MSTKVQTQKNENKNKLSAQCAKSTLTTAPDFTNLEELSKIASNIDTELEQSKSILKSVMNQLVESKSGHAEVLTVCKDMNNSNWTTAEPCFNGVKKMTGLSLTMSRMTANATFLNPNLLKTLEKRAIEKINDSRSDIAQFLDVLSCLQSNKELDKIQKNLSDLNSFRADQKFPPIVTAVEDALISVSSLNSGLKSLALYFSKRRKFASDKTSQFPNAAEHTNSIGPAAQEIARLEDVLRERANVDIIKNHAQIVQRELAASGATLAQDDKDNLEKLVALGASLDVMFVQLDAWKSGIKKSDSTKFVDYGYVFTEAKKVDWANLGGLMGLEKSLEKLVELVKDVGNKKSLGEVQDALKSLDDGGLEFSSFQNRLDEPKKALAALDLFFSNLFKPLPTAILPPPDLGNSEKNGPPPQ